jgi:hypothetical protein
MSQSDWLPPRDGDFRDWLERAAGALPGLKTTLSLADADVAALTGDLAKFKADLTTLDAASAAYDAAAKTKKAGRATIEARARALARRIKVAPGYTEAIGSQLRILGTEETTSLANAKPTITATPKTGGAVEIVFNKSKSDGVNIYTQRDGDTGWVFLARDTESPYVDTRSLLAAGKPEIRRYRAIYLVGDDETGQFSDEITVTATP